MRACLACGVVILGMVLGPLVAHADIPPTEPDPTCAGKKAGDACGARAACQTETCVSDELDGATSTRHECLQCRPSRDDGGCAIGTGPTVRRIGAGAAAGLFSLLFLFLRRRKR